MSESAITLPAFAKINWSLRVLSRRADGYHEIETVLQTISLHDTLTLKMTEEPQVELRSDDPSVPSYERNLVWQAASALREKYSEKRGVGIRLEKRIPHQAGLGGGSSDSAATLIGSAYLWKIKVAHNDLFEIADSLGADVPFFLFGGTARGAGRGEMVTPLKDVPETHLIVLKPNASVPTSKAYEALNSRALTTPNAKIILSSSEATDFSSDFALEDLHNDFEAVVFQLEPEIERAKAALLKAGANTALLAGSGSAVFGIFENQNAQERAIQAIELETGWRAFPCKTVGRSHYRSAMGPAGEVLARLSGEYAGA